MAWAMLNPHAMTCLSPASPHPPSGDGCRSGRRKRAIISERERQHRRAGLTQNEAVRRAHLACWAAFCCVKQQFSDSRGTKFVEDILQDLRYAMAVRQDAGPHRVNCACWRSVSAPTQQSSVSPAPCSPGRCPIPFPDRLAIPWLRSPGIGIPQDWLARSISRQLHRIMSLRTQPRFRHDFTLTDRSKARRWMVSTVSSSANRCWQAPMFGRIFYWRKTSQENRKRWCLRTACSVSSRCLPHYCGARNHCPTVTCIPLSQGLLARFSSESRGHSPPPLVSASDFYAAA